MEQDFRFAFLSINCIHGAFLPLSFSDHVSSDKVLDAMRDVVTPSVFGVEVLQGANEDDEDVQRTSIAPYQSTVVALDANRQRRLFHFS